MSCPDLPLLSPAPGVSFLSPGSPFPNSTSGNLLLNPQDFSSDATSLVVLLTPSSDREPLLSALPSAALTLLPQYQAFLQPPPWQQALRGAWVPRTGPGVCSAQETFLERFIERGSIFILWKIKMKKNIQCAQGFKLWHFYPPLVEAQTGITFWKVIWQHLIEVIKSFIFVM